MRRFWEEGGFSDEEDLWGEVQDFWSDDEDEPGKRRRAARGAPRPPRPGGPAKLRHHVVTHYNTVTQVGHILPAQNQTGLEAFAPTSGCPEPQLSEPSCLGAHASSAEAPAVCRLLGEECCGVQALIRRKVKAVDKDALAHIKVPLPLPLAWGRTVAPYTPPGEGALAAPTAPCGDENVDANADPAARDAQTKAVSIVARDVLATDWGSLRTRFQARTHASASVDVSG